MTITQKYQMEDEKYLKALGIIESIEIHDNDRGILSVSLAFDFGGSAQAIAPIIDTPLKTEDDKFISRVGTVFGCELIRLLMEGFCVNKLNDIKGKTALTLYYKSEQHEFSQYIRGIEIPKAFRSSYVKSSFIIDLQDVIEYCKAIERLPGKDIDNDYTYYVPADKVEYFKAKLKEEYT